MGVEEDQQVVIISSQNSYAYIQGISQISQKTWRIFFHILMDHLKLIKIKTLKYYTQIL